MSIGFHPGGVFWRFLVVFRLNRGGQPVRMQGMNLRFATVLLGAALLVSSCETCYDNRFAQELMGHNPDTVCAIVGMPTRVSNVGNMTEYVWYVDKSYDYISTTPGSVETSEDIFGKKRTDFTLPTVQVNHVTRYAKLAVRFIGNRAVSYDTSDSDMCNYWVPQSYINRYKQEDQQRKHAISESRISPAPDRY